MTFEEFLIEKLGINKEKKVYGTITKLLKNGDFEFTIQTKIDYNVENNTILINKKDFEEAKLEYEKLNSKNEYVKGLERAIEIAEKDMTKKSNILPKEEWYKLESILTVIKKLKEELNKCTQQ